MGWNSLLATTSAGWTTNLACDADASAPNETWTESPGSNENKPITCETWFEAYAFCIWDGGFLPSEAEWNYAAAGGAEQRVYPWSSPSTNTTIACSYANYDPGTWCVAAEPNDVGSESPSGDGLYGQADLIGNAWEWALDWYAGYVTPCVDCASVTQGSASARVLRGVGFDSAPGVGGAPVDVLPVSERTSSIPSVRYSDRGARCARSP